MLKFNKEDRLEENGRVVEDGHYTLEDGTQVWVKDGLKHRLDGPAEIRFNDYFKYWYYHGVNYRIEDPSLPSIIGSDGLEAYTDKAGNPHNNKGPALIYQDGEIQYWLNNKYYPDIKTDEEWVQEVLHILKGTSKNPFRNGTLKKEGYFRYRGQALRDYKELD